jgi:predicted ATPase/class 3 adenylate cyclase
MQNLPQGTVTLLFTDIEGSTQLLQQLGDHYASVLAECRRLLRTAFEQWNGYEVDTQGDAFFVVFARATDAISAAVTAQHALATQAFSQGVAVRARMGLHTGEPQRSSEGYIGLDVHLAARIMSSAHGGQVVLSQTTYDLVVHNLPDGVSLRDLGEHRLKDLQHSHRLFQLVIADLPADFPPLKTLDLHPNNLPVQPTPLIGREQEVTAIGQLLSQEDVRLLTLTGPGGMGKTRLGLQVAAELSDLFPGGVFFVDLSALRNPKLVVPTIAQTFGLSEGGGQSLLERLKAWLDMKQLLLLLDNFEQVADAALEVAALLAACPQLKAMVTSREVLHVRAEREFSVPPLELPELPHPARLPDLVALSHCAAVALFIQRARAVKPDFQLTATNARAVAEVCIRLDGLPLAIELAAARMKVLPPQALLARLDQRLAVLTGGARDVPARQQTLRNTIEWSYNLLDEEEQRLFRRLSVFVGGCTLEATEAIYSALDNDSDGAGQVLDIVASLIDKSLLHQTEKEEPRFMMLETIREYGLEALSAGGEMQVTRQAHADYYLRLSEEAEPELGGPEQVAWLERLERERDNLRAALHWFLEDEGTELSPEMALRLAAALERFWVIRGQRSEGRTELSRALARSEGVAALVRAKALLAAARLAFVQGDYDQGEALAQESLALFRQTGNTRGIALSLDRLGVAAWRRGNFAQARSLMDEDLSLFKEVGDKVRVAWSLFTLALLESKQGEYARARVLLEESLAMHKEVGNKRGMAASLSQLAGVLLVSQGDQAKAQALLEEGLALDREVDSKEGIAASLGLSAWFALSRGDAAMARSQAEQSIALYREMGHREGTAESLCFLARAVALQGEHMAARALYEESLAIAREVGDKELIATGLEGLAGVVALQGEPARAAQLWGAAEALREVIGAPLPPIDHAAYDRSVAAACAELGEKNFAAAWNEGRSKVSQMT